jgi:hypothetical protein
LSERKDLGRIKGHSRWFGTAHQRVQEPVSGLREKASSLGRRDRPIKKYLELAETLYRVEADKAKLASLSNQIIPTDDSKGIRPPQMMDVTDQSREILLGRSKYVGKSVPQAAYEILRESNRAMHAKELVQRLIEGGLLIKGKTPLTSIATSLKRDKRFKKVGPNTFEAVDDMLIQAV